MKLKLIVLMGLLTLNLCSCGQKDDGQGPVLLQGTNGITGAQGQVGIEGQSGSNGLNTLVLVSRFTSDNSICFSGEGVLVSTGLDVNQNLTLDPLEITATTVVCDGATGLTGANGQDGSNGLNGSNGNNGVDGTNGTNGTNGVNGTVVLPVQFCPGSSTVYPNTFPEIGFCINNNIYAVYSTNGGFLSLMTPGTYSSAGVGSACNFTIAANCVIQ